MLTNDPREPLVVWPRTVGKAVFLDGAWANNITPHRQPACSAKGLAAPAPLLGATQDSRASVPCVWLAFEPSTDSIRPFPYADRPSQRLTEAELVTKIARASYNSVTLGVKVDLGTLMAWSTLGASRQRRRATCGTQSSYFHISCPAFRHCSSRVVASPAFALRCSPLPLTLQGWKNGRTTPRKG